MVRVPIPRPGFLDSCEYLGYKHGARRWRSPEGDLLYTWDSLHGEVEVFDALGRHRGAVDAINGRFRKPARKGRTIDV